MNLKPFFECKVNKSTQLAVRVGIHRARVCVGPLARRGHGGGWQANKACACDALTAGASAEPAECLRSSRRWEVVGGRGHMLSSFILCSLQWTCALSVCGTGSSRAYTHSCASRLCAVFI